LTEVEIKARSHFRDFLTTNKRWSIAVAHRRAGKTVACIQKLTKSALECELHEPRFAYVAPLYNQAKDIAWIYLRHYARQIGADINESELRIDLPNSARVRLYGADNPDRLRGMYLDGIVLDEYADMRPSVWGEIIRPMLADRKGWATFIGTPKGRNEFFKLWSGAQENEAWYRLMLKASETGLIAPDELIDARRSMTPEQYEQEFECSFEAAIIGAYYGKEIAEAERAGRVSKVEYEPLLPVHTVWDLGKGANMAIWLWQISGGEIRVVDHIEGSHDQTIPDLVKALNRIECKWGDDWVPHDAKVKELGTGRTRVETLKSLGRKPRLVPDHHVMDGINAARLIVSRCWFDMERCEDGLEALRQYKADYDEKLRTFKNEPRHDWASHSADAFRYLAMAYREIVAAPVKEKGRFLGVGDINQVTLNDLWDLNKQPRSRRI
jgi:hypothetical protein